MVCYLDNSNIAQSTFIEYKANLGLTYNIDYNGLIKID